MIAATVLAALSWLITAPIVGRHDATIVALTLWLLTYVLVHLLDETYDEVMRGYEAQEREAAQDSGDYDDAIRLANSGATWPLFASDTPIHDDLAVDRFRGELDRLDETTEERR